MAYIDFQSSRILEQLKRDNPKAVESTNGKHLNRLTCPVCGKTEAFTYLDKPLAIICHRNNECGANTPIKQVYPELFENFAQHFPPTPKDPHATARAYLESRHLNPELINFRQGYVDKHQTLVIEQDGVTFQRLIDYRADGKGKNRLTPYSGKVFETAKVKANKANESETDNQTVFIVEAVIDALSLDQSGLTAIATYSSGAIPKEYYQRNKQHAFILAFDNDPAGISGIEKTITCFKELDISNYQIALPPKGKDWNDLLVDGQLDAEHIGKTLDTAYWQGRLTFAVSPLAYFEIYRERYPNALSLVFDFNGWTYKGYVHADKATVYHLTDCTLKILYSIEDDSIQYDSKLSHIIELYSNREGKNRVVFTTKELTSPTLFREKLGNSRQTSDCEQKDLSQLIRHLYDKKPPKVRKMQLVGYDTKSQCFVLAHHLYDPNGKRHELNDYGFFNQGIMPFHEKRCTPRIIELSSNALKVFVIDLHNTFSQRGLVSLGFWIASAFSHLIFDRYGFFPLISLYGATHQGKTTVTTLLNRCFFMDWEGISMTKANTQKGELRRISQKSSLVTPLLECTGVDNTRFSMDTILGAYNRAPLATRAQTTQGNETMDVPINGTLAFVQNIEPFSTKAQKERVISIHFSDNSLDTDTEAFKRLIALSNEHLAGVGDYIMRNRLYFETKMIGVIDKLAGLLINNDIENRIAVNHAIALAGVQLFIELLDIQCHEIDTGALRCYVVGIAKAKCDGAKTELDIAEHFFSMVDDLDSTAGVIHKDGLLYIQMPTVLKYLKDNYGDTTDKNRLFAELRRHDRFKDSNKKARVLIESNRYWIFTEQTE